MIYSVLFKNHSKFDKLIKFSTKNPSFSLNKDKVDLWLINLSDNLLDTNLANTLSAEEQSRYARFMFEKDKCQFSRSHRATRHILAKYLHCRPQEIIYATHAYGKPFIANTSIEFNLSHSGEFALLGVTKTYDLGVDIERYSIRDYQGLARYSFSEPETIEINKLTGAEQKETFFRIWSQKEAFIKATGQGLRYPLKDFVVSSRLPGGLIYIKSGNKHDWQISTTTIKEKAALSVCVQAKGVLFEYYNFNEQLLEI